MNDTLHQEKRPASDMTTADYVALTVMLLAIVSAWIALAMDNLKLMWLAIIVALPATVVKVRLTRARSQAAYREEQITSRERQVSSQARKAAEA